ncbi:FimV/HubP family polar landmark protein [Vibrio ponticus]|uniref:FimV/HubP family polar landmark protein n=1 Tax=Vibrio ponticus TaxID=265668 RepID=UPI0026B39F62|nr:FimV/HubP family polar landmark protein [Vibrio ponticus]
MDDDQETANALAELRGEEPVTNAEISEDDEYQPVSDADWAEVAEWDKEWDKQQAAQQTPPVEPQSSEQPELTTHQSIDDELSEREETPIELDELDLPEYGEEQALADFANEPGFDAKSVENVDASTAENAVAEPQVESEAAPAETLDSDEIEFDFDELDLPEYGEEQALADFANEPGFDAKSVENVDASTAENAVAEPQVESEAAPAPAEMLDSDDVAFDFDELDLPEYGEEQALADFANEPSFDAKSVESVDAPTAENAVVEPQVESEAAPAPALAPVEKLDSDDVAFDFDELDLPEYGEEQALADFANEPSFDAKSVESVDAPTAENAVAEPQVESEVAPALAPVEKLDSDEIEFAFDELDLPSAESAVSGEQDETIQDHFLDRTLDEGDVLAELFGGEDLATGSSQAATAAPSVQPSDYDDERTLSELLDEEGEEFQPITKPVDREVSDSAGMDIDAMLEFGGEDWNGFSLSPEQQASISDDIPEDEQQIWSNDNQPAQAKVHNEDWESQEDLADFNPRDHQYRTIDELMAEVEQQEAGFDPDTEELKLDVGLADFPDVIGEMSDIDVDSNSEAAGKLDLAKIYIEMNDASGAVRLLEEAIVDGSDEIRREAKRLIDSINSRA